MVSLPPRAATAAPATASAAAAPAIQLRCLRIMVCSFSGGGRCTTDARSRAATCHRPRVPSSPRPGLNLATVRSSSSRGDLRPLSDVLVGRPEYGHRMRARLQRLHLFDVVVVALFVAAEVLAVAAPEDGSRVAQILLPAAWTLPLLARRRAPAPAVLAVMAALALESRLA